MKKICILCFLCITSLCFAQNIITFLNNSEYDLNSIPEEELVSAKVKRVIDGDTIEVYILYEVSGLKNIETVRLIGVDTPETKDPRKPVQYFGKEASAFTKEQLTDKYIYLAFDNQLRDKYGRLLCYVLLEDRQLYNYNLIYWGYGHAYTYFPFIYMESFKEAEASARTNKIGLWENME